MRWLQRWHIGERARTLDEFRCKVTAIAECFKVELDKGGAVHGQSDGGDAASVGEVVQIPAVRLI